MKALKTSAEVFDHQGNDGWLQVTPGERFRIRTSAKETKGIYTMLELIAEFAKRRANAHSPERG